MRRLIGHRTVAGGIVALILSGAALLCWSLASARATSPHTVIKVDIGDRSAGATVPLTILIPNESDSERAVEQVERSCSCIHHELSASSVPAHASVELRTEHVAPQQRGPFSQTLVVKYKDSPATTTVKVVGTVAAWITPESDRIQFPDTKVGDKTNTLFTLETREPWPDAERNVELSFSDARIENCEAQSDRRRFQLLLSFAPSECLRPTTRRGEIIFRWSSQPDRTLRVPVQAFVVPDFSSEPDAVHFGMVQNGATVTKSVRVSAPSETSGDVLIRHNLGGAFTVLKQPTELDGAFDVVVRLNSAEGSVSGLQTGSVDIYTGLSADSKSERHQLQIPVAAYITPRSSQDTSD